MPRDKTESHERLLEAAKNEFMEYGFRGDQVICPPKAAFSSTRTLLPARQA